MRRDMQNILVVEDDHDLNQAICYSLKKSGYGTYGAESAESGRTEFLRNRIDLVLLDVNLPDGEGFSFCRWIKSRKETPVIYLTARDMEEDVLTGYESGAEDYITKPFSIKELMARINRIILRNKKNTIIQVQNIKFDMDKMVVYRDNENVELTNLELKILNLLFLNLNKVVKRSEIIDKIWEWTGNDVNDNTVTVYLKRIREKIKTDIIITIKGIGYRIDSEVY